MNAEKTTNWRQYLTRHPFNLQLFAEPAGAAASDQEGQAQQGAGEGGAQKAEAQKTLTQAEVDALIDKRFARERKDAERRIAEARAEGEKEGERRASLTADERLRLDREKAAREAGEREKALQEREAAITRRELRAEAIDLLQEKGLPKELEGLLDYSSADACKASIASVEKIFRASVQAGVEARIRQGGGSPAASAGAQKPDYTKMSDAEYYASLKSK